MCQYIGYWQFHDRSQTNCWTQVVSEYEECSSEYFKTSVQSNTVHCSSHTKLTYAEINVAAIIRFWCERCQTIQMRHSGAFQVSGTTH
ncbi:hypothetical protein D3C81_2124200 [compost metagenome]